MTIDLNAEQRCAAEAGDGPLLIVAGPGTGKTKTLAARIAFLIESGRAQSSDILALTFTKKAAAEMAERVRIKGVTICTFHALCHRLLGGEQEFIGDAERVAIIKSLAKPTSLKGVSTRELALLISRAKNQAEDAPDILRLAREYTTELTRRNLRDFDDILVQARDLLRDSPVSHPSYSYILVDEFQDTNMLQYEILQLIRNNDNLFVIGDPNQSIYAFRGASGTIFEQFKADLPAAAIGNLIVNYRSGQQIVALSNHIFADTPQLQAHSDQPGVARAVEVLNEYSEAQWVVNEIEAAIGGADMLQASAGDAHRSLRDFAILYRNRKTATIVQKYLREAGLPCQVVGEGSPYDQPEVQELIAMLQTSHEQGVGAKQPADAAAALAEQAELKTKEVGQFISTLVRFSTIPEALAHLEAIADDQFYDPAAEAITLLTIHASKGLEFPCVFVIGVEEGLLPYAKADPAEERRLFYVAATRAKDQLELVHATKRMGENATPSRFITEMSQNVLPHLQDPNIAGDRRRAVKRHAKRAQTSLF